MSLSKLGQEYATSEGSEEGECSSSDEGNTVRMFSSNQKNLIHYYVTSKEHPVSGGDGVSGSHFNVRDG